VSKGRAPVHGCLWAKTSEATVQCNVVPIKTDFCASSAPKS